MPLTRSTQAAKRTACDQNRRGCRRAGSGAASPSCAIVVVVVAVAIVTAVKVPKRDPKYNPYVDRDRREAALSTPQRRNAQLTPNAATPNDRAERSKRR